MIDFKDQAVIVTGAGRGLGRVYALEFARRGAAVVVNDLGGAIRGGGADGKVADIVVDEIRAAGGTAVASYDTVATPEGAAAIVQTAVDAFSRVDAVVANAGIVNNAPFEDITPDQWREMLAVHLDGSFFLAQSAFRVMKAQGYGRFVFTTSSASMFGAYGHGHYAAAKGGIFGIKNIVAIEGEPHGILANAILPWGTTRMMVESSGGNEAILDLPFLKQFDPELVVPMVVYLASRACRVSHQDYSAAAGRYARVFTALGGGWLSEAGSDPNADDIAAHFDMVSSTDGFIVPFSTTDETVEICNRRGVSFAIPG